MSCYEPNFTRQQSISRSLTSLDIVMLYLDDARAIARARARRDCTIANFFYYIL